MLTCGAILIILDFITRLQGDVLMLRQHTGGRRGANEWYVSV